MDEFDRLQDKLKTCKDKYSYHQELLIKRCKHNIKSAFINPLLCDKCSIEFLTFLKENQLPIRFQKLHDIKTKIENEKQYKINEEIIKKVQRREDKISTCIQKYRAANVNSEEIGRRYERQIGYLYEIKGWLVEYNGIKKGLDDKGIDIIAIKKKTHHVIQCKNYGKNSSIHINTIQQHKGVLDTYRRENKDVEVIGILYTSNDNLDTTSREELSITNAFIHYIEAYTTSYPLIKCKKSDEDMIYHLPCNASYDMIKIRISRGDRYVETEEEAISLGFRAANN